MLCCMFFILNSCRLGDCWFSGRWLHVLGFELLDSYVLDCWDHDLGFLVLGLESLGVGFLSFGMVGIFIHMFRPFGVHVYGFQVSFNSNIGPTYIAPM